MAEDGDIHLSSAPSVTYQWDRINATYRYEGDYDRIQEFCQSKNNAVGMPFLNGYGADMTGEDVRITGVSSGRTSGVRGFMQVDVVKLTYKFMVQLTMNELSKNIRTWKADDTQVEERPDLAKLAEWELWKEKGDQASLAKYNAYLDKDGRPLAGNTKKLAEMIYRGVQEYCVYQPSLVYTWTAYEVRSSDGANLGKVIRKPDMTPMEYTFLGPSGASVSEYQGLAEYFIKTGLNSSLNPDGTYSMNVTYLGVMTYEKDIYPEAN